jgi:DNA gyrase subunit B
MAKKSSDSNNYSAENISVLEGLEPVRKRPGMYIGSTGPDGLHHMIKEIFDNSRDEAMNGHCDHIEVTLLPDGYVRVADNGRGIPTDMHPKTKVSALETIMTVLHAGGKFGEGGYAVSGGLHGVGASVVNALSSHMTVHVHRDGAEFFQEYHQGKKKADVKKIGKSDRRGTIVSFKPDTEIFSDVKFSWSRIVSHYREQAYLVRDLRVVLIDAREYQGKIATDKAIYLREELSLEAPSQSFYFEGGIVSMVRHYNSTQSPVHKNIFYVDKTIDNIQVEVALQYVDDVNSRIIAFANNISTPGGGMHVTGFKTALTRLINNYAKANKVLTEKEGAFQGEDVLEGLVAVISVKMPEIQFEGQTKDKLGSTEARGAVESVFGEAFAQYLEEKPDDAKDIAKKIMYALRARKAAKAAKESILRKGALEGATLPGKLTDCQTRRADEAEVFIVEGDSAGGTAKQGRDRRTQAILPLRGKPLNVEKARLDKMVANNEIKNIIIALGTGISDTFNLDEIRYKKIIIATDADVDGAHIRTLLLTLFFRHLRPVVDAGYLYCAQPPLYKIKYGKEVHYAYNDDQKFAILSKLGVTDADIETSSDDESSDATNADAGDAAVETTTKSKKKSDQPQPRGKVAIQRYKGLGEMNAEELWETTMDPSRRILKQVTIDDAEEADRIFDILMGNDVPSRKLFIQTNAKSAQVDI